MASFGFFTDAGLTTALSGTLDFAQAVDGSTGPQQAILYFGSPTAGRVLRAAANPGVAPIVLSIVDASAGTGSPASDVTLALDPSFLGRAAGAALTLGTQVSGGAAAAVPIYVQVSDSTHTVGVNTDLTLAMTLCEET